LVKEIKTQPLLEKGHHSRDSVSRTLEAGYTPGLTDLRGYPGSRRPPPGWGLLPVTVDLLVGFCIAAKADQQI
jgi:hypothetical protein